MPTPQEELILKELWSSILGKENLTSDSDFFALGGESIQAMEMILRLERTTGKRIPIGTLYTANTLAQFAKAVGRINSDDKTPIVTQLNEQGTGRPLFLIAPAIGGVFHYKDFWQHVGEQYLTYCIEPRISTNGEHSYASVEEVASYLIKEMRSIQREGPYRLCGYSFGGSLAWEMARQLNSQKQRVECLIVLDSSVRGSQYVKNNSREGLAYWARTFWRSHWDHRANGQWLNIPCICRLVCKKFFRILLGKGGKSNGEILPNALESEVVENRVQEVLRSTYDYGTWPGELIFLRARCQLTLHRQLDYDLGWKERAEGGLRIIPIPGNHLNMMRPPACIEIARVVGDLLGELEAGETAPDSLRESVRPQVEFNIESVSTVLHQFYQVLNKLGDNCAIVDEGEYVSFRQLNDRANTIAAALSEISAHGEGVYVFLPTTHWIVAAFLGVFKAGHYYVPVDPDNPDSRISLIFEDAQCSCMITSRELSSRVEEILPGRTIPTVIIEDLTFTGDRQQQEDPTQPEDLGVILYTSGSTGKPKGVVQKQKSISSIAWRRGMGLSLQSNDRYLQIYSGAFMGGLNAIYGGLLHGSCLYFYNLKSKGISQLGPWLNAHGITVFHTVTSIYRQFIGTVSNDSSFPTIRCIVPGGEPSRMSDIRQFKQVFERESVYFANLGSSECGSIAFEPIRHDTEVHPDIPVGVPFSCLEVMIFDQYERPVPPGTLGQIVVLSDSIFKEYWNEPDRTRVVMKPQPDGRALFFTGDYGYIMEDGRLVNKGRQDGQAKINGYRVEIPEVESAILSVEGVRETAVVTREDLDGNLRLAAFVRVEGDSLSVTNLSGELLKRLPRPMVPTHIIPVSRFPLKDNGKLDRRLLSRIPTEEMDFVIRD